MKLPKIELPSIIFDCVLPVSKEKIHFKPYLVGHEKGFLAAGNSGDVESLITNYEDIISPLIINDDFDFKKITSLIDFMYLSLNFRCKSKDEKYSAKLKKCEHCAQTGIEFEIDIVESLKFENEDVISAKYDVAENLQLHFKPLRRSFLNNAGEITDKYDLYKHTLAHCTTMIVYDKQPYKDFTEQELLDDVFSKFTESQILKCFNEVSKMIQMYLGFDVKCPNCGKDNSFVEKNFLQLLK